MEKIIKTFYINIRYYLNNYLTVPFLIALLITALCLFIRYKKDKECRNFFSYIKVRSVLKKTLGTFITSFYLTIIVHATVLSRLDKPRQNPLSNIWGGWKIEETMYFYDFSLLWNIVLFLPMCFVLVFYSNTSLNKKHSHASLLIQSALYSFAISLFIELSQLILRVGTFQFADLFYNVLGGISGAVLFITITKIMQSRKEPSQL